MNASYRTVRSNEQVPTCGQIDRACRLYGAGAQPSDFIEAFSGIAPEAVWLLWHAARGAAQADDNLVASGFYAQKSIEEQAYLDRCDSATLRQAHEYLRTRPKT